MLGRALILAAVTLLTGCFAVFSAPAQAQNLEAGKSPSQIFAGACAACHKSPRGLLKSVPAGSLQGFLRQHYTTSPEMASLLSAFLVSNGAADTRYVGAQPKPAKDAKSEPGAAGPPDQLDRFGRRLRRAAPAQEPESGPRETAKPDADGISPQAEPGGRNARRMARPGGPPEGSRPAAEGRGPAEAVSEGGPEGRKSAIRQKLGKRGKHVGEEPPDAAKQDSTRTDSGKLESPKPEPVTPEPSKPEPSTSESVKSGSAKDEPAQGEAAKDDRPKSEGRKEEGAKPLAGAKSESTRTEPPKTANGGGETPPLRADPVPAVTAAPPAGSATASGPASEPAAAPSAPAAQPAPAPAVTASAPPPSSPTDPVGPPVPPISK